LFICYSKADESGEQMTKLPECFQTGFIGFFRMKRKELNINSICPILKNPVNPV
jgi:hypothetical protein